MKTRTQYVFILLTSIFLCSCSSSKKTDINTKEKNGAVYYVYGSANLVIDGLQELLKPDGKPLTTYQITQIKECYRPQHGDEDMKIVIGLLTIDQKKVLLNHLKNQLNKLGYPLDKKQMKLFMDYGQKSTVIYRDIITDEQKKALLSGRE